MQSDFLKTSIQGLLILQRSRIEDSRGYLSRMYSADLLGSAGVHAPVAQINHTLTRLAGAVRGMHFQRPPHAEFKVVSCLRGEVFDVAVDLRSQSPTFLMWHGEVLSAANQRSLVIPEGCAHGFQTLTPDCELLYLHTAGYQPSAEGGVNPTDPRVAIAWPLPIAQMSDRDRAFPVLEPGFPGIAL